MHTRPRDTCIAFSGALHTFSVFILSLHTTTDTCDKAHTMLPAKRVCNDRSKPCTEAGESQRFSSVQFKCPPQNVHPQNARGSAASERLLRHQLSGSSSLTLRLLLLCVHCHVYLFSTAAVFIFRFDPPRPSQLGLLTSFPGPTHFYFGLHHRFLLSV